MTELVGRRERRKRQTHRAIQSAALELFAEHGFAATTIAAIADAADVAPRTVTLHFPTKEDVLFAHDPFHATSLGQHLRDRTPGRTTLPLVREWLAATMAELAAATPQAQQSVWHLRRLRAVVVAADDGLRGRSRAGDQALERLVAEGVAADEGVPADALGPRLAGLTVITGVRELYLGREVASGGRPGTEELLELVDQVLAFADAGLAASRVHHDHDAPG